MNSYCTVMMIRWDLRLFLADRDSVHSCIDCKMLNYLEWNGEEVGIIL